MSAQFDIENDRLVLKTGPEETWVREFSTEEIFTRPNLSPFVMFATTKGGKTTIGIDIVHECAKAGFNQFNFVTSSYLADTNTDLRNNVLPQCVIHNEDEICVKLNQIWDENENENQPTNDIIIKTGESIASVSQKEHLNSVNQRTLNNLKQKIGFIQSKVCRDNQKSVELLSSLRNTQDPKQFINYLQQKKDEIRNSIKSFQDLDVEYGGQQCTCIKGLNLWLQECDKIYHKYTADYIDMMRQIIRNRIKQEVQKNSPQLICDYFSSGKSANKVINELMPLIIEQRRLCLVIDDISHVLASNSKQKILIDNQQMSQKDAINIAFNKIFNKGRHLGTIFVGVHSTQTLNATQNSLISNVILNSQTDISKSMNRSLFIMSEKEAIQNYLNALRTYNESNGTYYTLICYKDISQSPDGKSRYILYQAREHKPTSFDYQSYKHSPFFYALAVEHAKKQAGGHLDIQSDDEYDDEDEYAEDEEEDEYEEDESSS